MPADFYSQNGLNVETYDLERDMRGTPCEGDVDFYLEMARQCGDPVLELASGTGRVTFPLAEGGFEAVGLERSPAMLARANEKLALAAPATARRLRFLAGDMASFELERRFPLIIIPFRAFQALLTPELERDCLESIRRHLTAQGTLVVDLFDPRLDLLAPGRSVPSEPLRRNEVRHPRTGNVVRIEVLERVNHPVEQVIEESWRFSEIDSTGTVVREESETLRLRWLYRFEMRHLLELCGFQVEAEYSDFFRSPPDYGKEQVWVARLRA